MWTKSKLMRFFRFLFHNIYLMWLWHLHFYELYSEEGNGRKRWPFLNRGTGQSAVQRSKSEVEQGIFLFRLIAAILVEKGAIHILRGAASVKKTPRKSNQTEISARSCNLLLKSYISSGSCEAAIHIWRQGEGFAGVRSPRQSRPRLLRGIEWSVKLKPDSGSDLKSFFVRLVVVEHLHHHLNLLDEIPWCWIARWQVQCTRQRYNSALVKQNKNQVQWQPVTFGVNRQIVHLCQYALVLQV